MDSNIPLVRFNNQPKRYIIHQGGTGSGKTWSILQYLLLKAALDPQRLTISVVSESLPHLKRGVFKDMRKILAQEKLPVLLNKTDHYFEFRNGTRIEFFPADAGSKLRGARRDILFINECNNVTFESFTELDVRTSLKTLLDFNPVTRFWAHDEVVDKYDEKDVAYIQTTYRDNKFLSPAEIENIERRRGNINWWKVYGEGETGMLEGLVFKDWDIYDDSTLGGQGVCLGFGVDFGFINNPTAIVKVTEWGGEYYLEELLYKKGFTNEQLLEWAKAHLDLTLPAFGDSSEQRTIDWLYRNGWKKLKACVKGSGSVAHGINLLLDRKLHLHKNSTNLINEFRNYMWESDNRGRLTNEPVKDFDHCADAARYVVFKKDPKDFGSH